MKRLKLILLTVCLVFITQNPPAALGVPITGLQELTSPANNDLLEIVDVSDTSMASSGTNKKITLGNLLGTNLGALKSPTAWRLFMSNGEGAIYEIQLGAAGTYLQSTGTSSAPTWDAPSGAGDITSVFDCSSGACNVVLVTNGMSLSFTSGGVINASHLEGTDLGTLTDGNLCAYDEANTEIDCNISYSAWDTDASNDLTTSTNWSGGLSGTGSSPSVVSDSDWTAHNSYPSACPGGQFVTAIGDTLTCSTPSGGGDVSGPQSSTDNAVARFDGTGGKTLQNSSVIVDDNGSVTIPNQQGFSVATTTSGHFFALKAYDNDASTWVDALRIINGNTPEVQLQEGVLLSGLGPIAVKNGATSGGYIDIYEDSDNGTDYIRIKADDDVGTNRKVTISSSVSSSEDLSITLGNNDNTITFGSSTNANQLTLSNMSIAPSSVILPDSNTSPTVVGQIVYDNTVTGLDDGAMSWYDHDEVKYFVDITASNFNRTDNYVLAYDADTGKWFTKEDATGGGGSGDISAVGDCSSGDAFTGTCGSTLTFVSGSYTLTLSPTTLTADRIVSFPNQGGTITVLGSTINANELAAEDFGDFTCDGTSCNVDSGAVTLDEIANGTSYERVAAADVDSNGHVNVLQDSDGTGSISVTGLSASRTKTFRDASDTVLEQGGSYAPTGAWDFGGATSVELPNGSSPTVDATGEIAIDTTSDQLQYYGASAKRALPAAQAYSLVVPSVADTDDMLFIKLPYGITASAIDCIVSASTSATINIQECDSTGGSCADMATSDLVCDTDGANTTSFSDSSADAGNWLKLDVASISGTPGTLTVTFKYYVTAD